MLKTKGAIIGGLIALGVIATAFAANQFWVKCSDTLQSCIAIHK
jgi:hypothetical protein